MDTAYYFRKVRFCPLGSALSAGLPSRKVIKEILRDYLYPRRSAINYNSYRWSV